jgi:hypothetical protein
MSSLFPLQESSEVAQLDGLAAIAGGPRWGVLI